MNIAILTGRLTKDPELRHTTSNKSVCSFTIAVDRRFKNSAGEREADFLPCVAWGQTGEFIDKYFKKGNKINVTGSIQTRSWEADGGKRYATEIIVEQAEFGESKSSTADSYHSNLPDV